MTRTVRSGSPYRSDGAEVPEELAFFSISSHCAFKRRTSRSISASAIPSAAVRIITPASSGTKFFKIDFKRERS